MSFHTIGSMKKKKLKLITTWNALGASAMRLPSLDITLLEMAHCLFSICRLVLCLTLLYFLPVMCVMKQLLDTKSTHGKQTSTERSDKHLVLPHSLIWTIWLSKSSLECRHQLANGKLSMSHNILQIDWWEMLPNKLMMLINRRNLMRMCTDRSLSSLY